MTTAVKVSFSFKKISNSLKSSSSRNRSLPIYFQRNYRRTSRLCLFPLFRWDRTAESPIRDWPISTRERVHARQYRLPGDRRRGGRDGRVHPRENGFPRENQGYVTQSRRRVRVVHFYFFFSFSFPPLFSRTQRRIIQFPFYIPPSDVSDT